MSDKAQISDVRFRPHFKTHQSKVIAEWFRRYGTSHITVSSLSMAAYFARHGWTDITVAFPLNPRELQRAVELSEEIRLNLLILDAETAELLNERLSRRIDVWLKVDTGYGRTGIRWNDPEAAVALARKVDRAERLEFRGLLTHAGQSYHTHSLSERRELFAQTARRLASLKGEIVAAGVRRCELSVGDTPTSAAVERFEGVDELRPGNFVYFDAQQYHIGSCGESEIAATVACPVVSVHPERGECVLYGGAVHLSAQREEHPEGGGMHGYVVPLAGEDGFTDGGGEQNGAEGAGWGSIDRSSYVRMVSQEHGVAVCSPELLASLRPGSLLGIIPVHSCLAVDLLDSAQDTAGNPIELGRF